MEVDYPMRQFNERYSKDLGVSFFLYSVVTPIALLAAYVAGCSPQHCSIHQSVCICCCACWSNDCLATEVLRPARSGGCRNIDGGDCRHSIDSLRNPVVSDT